MFVWGAAAFAANSGGTTFSVGRTEGAAAEASSTPTVYVAKAGEANEATGSDTSLSVAVTHTFPASHSAQGGADSSVSHNTFHPYYAESYEGRTVLSRGYWLGGAYSGGSSSNTITALSFLTDTALPVITTLPAADSLAGEFESAAYGYLVGGFYSSTPDDSIRRLRFLDETTSMASAALPTTRYQGGSAKSSVAGYIAGGSVPLDSVSATIAKMAFSTEAASTTAASLSLGRNGLAGASSSVKGYFAGGVSGSVRADIDSLDFSTDTISAVAAVLLVPREKMGSIESANDGYWAGGRNATPAYVQTTDDIRFSDDTRLTVASGLSVARDSTAGIGSSSSGYFGGGYNNSPSGGVDKLVFSSNTMSALSATVSPSRYALGGVSYPGGGSVDHGTTAEDSQQGLIAHVQVEESSFPAGYIFGGREGIGTPTISSTESIKFSTESMGAVSATTSRYNQSAVQSQALGYLCGGYDDMFTISSSISGVEFRTGTNFAAAASLTNNGMGHAGVSGDSNGYLMAGGATTDRFIHRVGLATGSSSRLATILSLDRTLLAGSQSATKGYAAGGGNNNGSHFWTIESIQFDTEAVATLGAHLTASRQELAAAQSSSKAYFAGGVTDITTALIDELAFSTETVAASVMGLYNMARGVTGLSSNDKGYWCGGRSPVTLSVIRRMVFASATIGDLSAALSTARYGASGLSCRTPSAVTDIASVGGTERSAEFTAHGDAVVQADGYPELPPVFVECLAETSATSRENWRYTSFSASSREFATATSHANKSAVLVEAINAGSAAVDYATVRASLHGAFMAAAGAVSDVDGFATLRVSIRASAEPNDAPEVAVHFGMHVNESALGNSAQSASSTFSGGVLEAATARSYVSFDAIICLMTEYANAICACYSGGDATDRDALVTFIVSKMRGCVAFLDVERIEVTDKATDIYVVSAPTKISIMDDGNGR